MIRISPDSLSEEEFETVVQSRGFQKMVLYQRLAEGIEVLRTHDLLYESMVQAITEQHSEIESPETTQELLSLLEREVATYTDPLTAEDGEELPLAPDAVQHHDETSRRDSADDTDPEEVLRTYLDRRLEDGATMEMKAKDIAEELGLQSTHVGGILGRWRHADDPPFAITAAESTGSGNLWMIEQATGEE